MPKACKRKITSGSENEKEVESLKPKKLSFIKSNHTHIIKDEKLKPREELLVAKKKLDQIRAALESKEVIVIEGPPGCGKTWTTKNILEGKAFIEFDWLEYKNEALVASFLKKCTFLHKQLQLIHVIIDNADGIQEQFIKALLNNKYHGQQLIFIFNSITSRSLFKDEDCIEIIQLNPLTTFAIKRLLAEKVPLKSINEIATSCFGDARVALIMAEEYNIHGNFYLHNRDRNLEFFHSIGKILYPRKDSNTAWPLENFEIEDYAIFNSYLHFNCIDSVDSLEALSTVMDSFSLVQNSFSLREHPSRLLSYLINSGRKQKSSFGLHKPPIIYFR